MSDRKITNTTHPARPMDLKGNFFGQPGAHDNQQSIRQPVDWKSHLTNLAGGHQADCWCGNNFQKVKKNPAGIPAGFWLAAIQPHHRKRVRALMIFPFVFVFTEAKQRAQT
ncbi:hypothetical protein [Roseibium sp. SCP14]|uniref:hypothetical protein n=1 Tax=Roseibium sp. SCP14 TaxID=3141375 RepID=UPI00333D1099